MRLYSLFERQGGCWRRLSTLALSISAARVFWQDALLAPVFHGGPERRLRPVLDGAVSVVRGG